MHLYQYPCIYYSITDYVLSSVYSDLSLVPVISEGCRSGRTSSELVPESTRTGLSRTFNDMK